MLLKALLAPLIRASFGSAGGPIVLPVSEGCSDCKGGSFICAAERRQRRRRSRTRRRSSSSCTFMGLSKDSELVPDWEQQELSAEDPISSVQTELTRVFFCRKHTYPCTHTHTHALTYTAPEVRAGSQHLGSFYWLRLSLLICTSPLDNETTRQYKM